MTINHECPWVGGVNECHCLEDGSLCSCSHQKGMHGDAPIEYETACTECGCHRFAAAGPLTELIQLGNQEGT